MGFAPDQSDFRAYRFLQDGDATPTKNGFQFNGTVTWAVAADGEHGVYTLGFSTLVSRWNGRGYKIGLLLQDKQEITQFVYGGVALEPMPDVLDDLRNTFGTPAGHEWAAWGHPDGNRQFVSVAPNLVTFKVQVELCGDGPATQLIPVVSRHMRESFFRSMPGLWVVARPKVAMKR